jgi:glutaconate CoA-transferase subunit B
VVPRVILFTQVHSPRVLVDTVDFVSAPGTSPSDVHRPGGPHALVTPRSVFRFDRDRARFVLSSVHPGVTPEEVRAATGFAYDEPTGVPATPTPDRDTLRTLRGEVARTVADTYPAFAAKAWGIGR